jgi:hypothetical protein
VIAGAAGGVGSIAVQLARRAGATVLGIADPSNDTWLTGYGADPVNYGDDLPARLLAAAKSGHIDALLDFFGGGYMSLWRLACSPAKKEAANERGSACLVSRSATDGEFCRPRDSAQFVGKNEPRSLDCAVTGVISVDVLVVFGPNSASCCGGDKNVLHLGAFGVRVGAPPGRFGLHAIPRSTVGQSIADPLSCTRRRTAVTSESPAAQARILACSRVRSHAGGQASSAHSSRRANNPFTE